MSRKQTKAINGVIAPGPRFTRWALWYFILHVAIPVMSVASLLDIGLWYLSRTVGTGCYALLCFVL